MYSAVMTLAPKRNRQAEDDRTEMLIILSKYVANPKRTNVR